MNRSTIARVVLAAAALVAVVLPAAATAASKAKTPSIWAHRGGSYVNGKAKYPENTLPAFIAAAKKGYTLETDVQLSKDGVPFILHDATLDRTTTCTGNAEAKTWAELSACRSDILGSPGAGDPLGPLAGTTTKTVAIPKFADVLKVARKYKVPIAPELKAYDTTNRHALAMYAAIKKSKVSLKQVFVQCFFTNQIQFMETINPKVLTSMLTTDTIDKDTAASIKHAQDAGADIVSPSFVSWVGASYVKAAHAAGFKVAVWTLDTAADVKRAKKIKADTLITNDPYMATKALK